MGLENKIMVAGFGATTETFRKKVIGHLTSSFGYDVEVLREPIDRNPFLDGENRLAFHDFVYNSGVKDKIVYVIMDTRVYDHRLLFAVRELSELVRKREVPSEITELVSQILTFVDPKLTGYKYAPLFGSIENNPNSRLREATGLMHFLKTGSAKRVVLAQEKSSGEWSHNFDKTLAEKRRWEIPFLRMLFREFKAHGADGVIYIHPHAPVQGVEYAEREGLDYIGFNPQGLITVNQEKIDIFEFFTDLKLNRKLLQPFDDYLATHSDGLYYRDKCFIVAPDEGSFEATKEFARRNNLKILRSYKQRMEEGVSGITSTDNIDEYLDQLNGQDSGANVTFLIIDDKLNSGGTGNKEARKRKDQVSEYNKQNGAHFKSRVELWCTHIRYPYLENLSHDDIDRIIVLDTVPYLPPLEEQLRLFGLDHKVNVLHGVSYQMATAIALDYKMHVVEREITQTHPDNS